MLIQKEKADLLPKRKIPAEPPAYRGVFLTFASRYWAEPKQQSLGVDLPFHHERHLYADSSEADPVWPKAAAAAEGR